MHLLFQETLKLLIKILKSPGCRKIPVLVGNKDDVVVTATNFTSERFAYYPGTPAVVYETVSVTVNCFVLFLIRVCPIFQISNVTGENIDLLKMFLNLLNCRTKFDDKETSEFLIDDTFSVPVNTFAFLSATESRFAAVWHRLPRVRVCLSRILSAATVCLHDSFVRVL